VCLALHCSASGFRCMHAWQWLSRVFIMSKRAKAPHVEAQDLSKAIALGLTPCQLATLLSGEPLWNLEELQNSKGRRELLEHLKELVHCLLQVNPSGVFNRLQLASALEHFDKANNEVLSRGKSKAMWKESLSYVINSAFQELRKIKRNIKVGTRTPPWLMDLMNKLVDDEQIQEDSLGDSLCDFAIEDSVAHLPTTLVKKKRPLLRRRSDCSTSSSSETLVLGKPIVKKNKVAHKVYYDMARDCAFKLSEGVLEQSCAWVAHQGFKQFIWQDGFQWTSEEPVPIRKKPASKTKALVKEEGSEEEELEQDSEGEQEQKAKKKQKAKQQKKKSKAQMYTQSKDKDSKQKQQGQKDKGNQDTKKKQKCKHKGKDKEYKTTERHRLHSKVWREVFNKHKGQLGDEAAKAAARDAAKAACLEHFGP
jgi:hypothetical protein